MEQVKLNIFFMLLQKKLRLEGVSIKLREFSPFCFLYNIRKVVETATEILSIKQGAFQRLYSLCPLCT